MWWVLCEINWQIKTFFSVASRKWFVAAPKTMISKKPFFGRAEGWSHMLIKPDCGVELTRTCGCPCCLSKWLNPRIYHLPNRRGVMKKHPTSSNSTAWGLYLERFNQNVRCSMMYTKLNISVLSHCHTRTWWSAQGSLSEMELHWRWNLNFCHILFK